MEFTAILTLSEHKSICNLAILQNIKILFDCGWDESFSEYIAEIYQNKITFDIDHIFISNNSIKNFGALPLLNSMGKLKTCTIHCTTPIAKLGFYILVDSISAKIEMNENFNFFSESDIQQPFANIREVKYKESVEIKLQDFELVIFPIPSGASLGGSCWKINYKLQSIVYAPQINLENKYICDPFPYEDLKNPNYFITDSKFSKKISLKKIVIENKFKKNLLSLIEKNKHIFIPSDVANINLELIISIDRILDEYNISKSKEDIGKNELNYKIILFGYSSREIIESFKSLIEFMGASFARQFYSYNETSIYLKYVECFKDDKEFVDFKNKNPQLKFILISSMESLDSGISYKIFPKILEDPDFFIFILLKASKNSILRELARKYQEGERSFEYLEIKRTIISEDIQENQEVLVKPTEIQTPEIHTNEEQSNAIEEQKIGESSEETNYDNSFKSILGDNFMKKKLFAKKEYPMFYYDKKKKNSEYGLEFTEKELKAIKSKLQESNENFETEFKYFLNEDSKAIESKIDVKKKIMRKDLFSKATYEYANKKVFIRLSQVDNIDKFTYYPLFNSIDLISKQTILNEINPKNNLIFLGIKNFENFQSDKNLKITYLHNKDEFNSKTNKFIFNFNFKILNVQFDSSILQKMSYSVVKDFGCVYDLKNSFLKIKTKRNNFSKMNEISLIYQDEIKISDEKTKINIYFDEENSDNEELDFIYNKNNLRLLELKKEITKHLNEDIIIFGDFISNKNKDFKLYLKNGDIVLEGNYNCIYLKIRKFIQDYMNSYNYNNEISTFN